MILAASITDAQQAAGGTAGRMTFGEDGGATLDLAAPVTLPQLRRHKRGFMKLATQNSFTITGSDHATRLFVSYLQSQLV